MGQGKGNIEFFVARVPAGRVMFKTLGSESSASFQSVTHIQVALVSQHKTEITFYIVQTIEKLISEEHWQVAGSRFVGSSVGTVANVDFHFGGMACTMDMG